MRSMALDEANPGPSTICAHAGSSDKPSATRPLGTPIYLTSAYAFPNMETIDEIYEGQAQGYLYGRYGSPNHAWLEEAVAALEGTEAAVATSSGMGAVTAVLGALAQAGDHVLVARDCYGGTFALLSREFRRLGVDVTFVDMTCLDAAKAGLQARTRLVWVETISNPTMKLADVEALAALAHARGALLVVDNTFATPYHCRPATLGADLVLHSVTKFIGGHHDLMAGIVAGGQDLIARVRSSCVAMGTNLSPFEAWLALRGLKTLALRVERSSANALALARFFAEHPCVERVCYPGLPGHPQRALADRLLARGFGPMVSFDVGSEAAAFAVVNRLARAPLALTLGGVETSCSYPAKSSHRAVPEPERLAMGVTPGLVRVSTGIEEIEDILTDFRQALEGPPA